MLKTVKNGCGIRVDPPLFFQNSHIFPFFSSGNVPFFKDYGYQFCTPSIYLPTQVKGFEGELKQVLDKAVSTFSFSMVETVPNFHFFQDKSPMKGYKKWSCWKRRIKRYLFGCKIHPWNISLLITSYHVNFWNPSVFSKYAKCLSCEVLTQFCEIFDINSENWHQVNRILDQSNSLPGQGSLFRLEMWSNRKRVIGIVQGADSERKNTCAPYFQMCHPSQMEETV